MLKTMLQNRQWVISCKPDSPKRACGRSNSIPNGPCCRKSADNHPDLANDGRSNVYIQITKPTSKPASAPW